MVRWSLEKVWRGTSPFPYVFSNSTYTVPLFWNNQLLAALRTRTLDVPLAVQALAIVSTCMYDAWAAFDTVTSRALSSALLRRPFFEEILSRQEEAISYAAYQALVDLFPEQQRRFTTALKVGKHKGWHSVSGYSSAYAKEKSPQSMLSQWTQITPFALYSSDQFRPPLPPATNTEPRYAAQATTILNLSAQLTDQQKMIAEYWMGDTGNTGSTGGAGSSQILDRWNVIAQYVMRRDIYDLEHAVKLFFILNNTLLDACIACWDTKYAYASVRPITAIHKIYAGRSVQAWAGPYKGTRLIDGTTWQPYQLATRVSTAPLEYCSAHSTLSAAAATILSLYTGSDYFGGAHTCPAGSSEIEPDQTPRNDVTLYWQTFSAAAEQAGLACRYGGIHFEQSDLVGRILGRAVASVTWLKAQQYIQSNTPG